MSANQLHRIAEKHRGRRVSHQHAAVADPLVKLSAAVQPTLVAVADAVEAAGRLATILGGALDQQIVNMEYLVKRGGGSTESLAMLHRARALRSR